MPEYPTVTLFQVYLYQIRWTSTLLLFTTSELKAASKQLKGSKAFGPDNIPVIIWKEEKFHTLLLNLCNHTLSTSVAPRIWHQAQIIPLPKKVICHLLLIIGVYL